MQLRLAFSALLFTLLSLPGPCLADDDPATGLEVKLVNLPDGKGSSFTLSGKTKPLPDGTQLVVTVGAVGRSRNYVATIKRTEVQNNQFHLGEVWPKQRLAPLLYRVRVVLTLKKQPPAIKSWIMSEYGYAAGHQEVIDQVDTRGETGTAADQLEFTLGNLSKLEAMALELVEMHEHVKALTSKPAAEVPDYQQQEEALNGRLKKLRAAIDLHYASHVVLLQQGFRKRIKGGGSDLSLFLRNHRRGQSHPEALAELGKRFGLTVTMIRQLKPTSLDDPLIPDEAEDEAEGEGEGDKGSDE